LKLIESSSSISRSIFNRFTKRLRFLINFVQIISVRGVTGEDSGSGEGTDDGVFEEIPTVRGSDGRRRRLRSSRSCIGAEESLRCDGKETRSEKSERHGGCDGDENEE
jgi:hypothetical protein